MSEKKLSGRCDCDVPRTAHDVRRLAACSHCGDLGKDLVATTSGKMHALCAMMSMPAAEIAPAIYPRLHICCLVRFSGDDIEKAVRTNEIIRRLAGVK